MGKEVGLLRQVAEKRGWKAVILDVDDTVADSSPLWVEAFGELGRRIAAENAVDPEEIRQRANELNNLLYVEFGVHPRKYAVIASRLAEEMHLDEEKLRNHMRVAVDMIYNRAPSLFPGARKTLAELMEADLKVEFATHSPEGRAKILMREWGYDGVIPVVTQSTLGPKNEKIWIRAMDNIGVRPDQVLMVGDNLKGDIISAGLAGIRDRVWVKPRWSLYGQGEVPGDVIKIEHIGELVRALIVNFENN